MTSVKGMDADEVSSAALNLHPEDEINQVLESAKVKNSRIWKYLTEFMSNMIRAP